MLLSIAANDSHSDSQTQFWFMKGNQKLMNNRFKAKMLIEEVFKVVKKSIHHHKFLRLFVYGCSLLTPKNIMFPCSKKIGIQSAGRSHVILCFL